MCWKHSGKCGARLLTRHLPFVEEAFVRGTKPTKYLFILVGGDCSDWVENYSCVFFGLSLAGPAGKRKTHKQNSQAIPGQLLMCFCVGWVFPALILIRSVLGAFGPNSEG